MEPAIPASSQAINPAVIPGGDVALPPVGNPHATVSRSTTGDALEAQIRECFGRVVYSHKTHEKCADRALARLSTIKVAQILLSAVTTGGLLGVVLGPPGHSHITAALTAVVSTALLALNAYTKENDLGKISQQHKETADKLWAIRESYLSIIADQRAGALRSEEVRARRDDLQRMLATVYESAPRTTPKGYADASQALKLSEDLTFSDAEIDQFLPGPLKSSA